MEYLGHIVVTTDELDYDSQEGFTDSMGGQVLPALRGPNLLYANNRYQTMTQNILDNDEAIVFISETRKTMLHSMKKWSSMQLVNGKSYIASKRQLAIVCGSQSKLKKTTLGTYVKGQPATFASNLKAVGKNVKLWAKGHRGDRWTT